MCDDVAANYASSPVNHDLGDASPANSPRSPSSNDSDSGDDLIATSSSNWYVMNASICDSLFTRLKVFIQITYFIFVLI